jgi:Pyruvate/2-oxoacid:ferredoxin oxidoreductase gamma subunit
MLGAFAAFTGLVSTKAIAHGVREHFSGSIAEKNIQLVEKVYEESLKKNG